MSSTVRAYGFVAALSPAILDKQEREELSEKLYDKNSLLRLSYNGNLVYIDYNANASYAQRENFYGLQIGGRDMHEQPHDSNDLLAEAENYGLNVDPTSIRSYNCVWYNGGDCPLNMLSLEEFLGHIQAKSQMFLVTLYDNEDVFFYLLDKEQWDALNARLVMNTCEFVHSLAEKKKAVTLGRTIDLIRYLQEHNIELVDELQDVSY